jgi:hypothetical protein
MKLQRLMIITIVLLSCTTNQSKTGQGSKGDLIQNHTAITNQSKNDPFAGSDSLLVPSFEVEIVLSEKAKERMLTPRESIIVFTEFFGEPKDSSDKGLNETGDLMLASSEKEINSPWVTKIENILISRETFDRLKNKDFSVLVQIWSGRRSSEYNLLHGELIDGTIGQLKGKRHKLQAKLIEER